MSAKGKFARLLGNALLRRGRVVEVGDVAPGFRRLVFESDTPKPAAGMKVQVLLPADDMRTYTPVALERGIALLCRTHGSGPAARWLSQIKIGDELRFMGPQRSLSLDPGPVILVGDETSIATAAAFGIERPQQVHGVFLVASPEAAREAAKAVGLQSADFVATDDSTGAVNAIVARLAEMPGATVALTGGSPLVLAVRDALRERGVRNLKTKTYWIPGRAGLD
ncbi:MAG TPA: siderophore-interacting protein [Povalibacter sp.]|uniref:siderophore-interacting protein n=1 Tax=Povalibacter sp. TaxID=1962978 RepID=UPI002CD5A532|nr:siderophore-interacting protein [Povalibacter sp.]HMN43519.1 siderophore-interacting protein [Povalibacter sp.]